MADNSPSKLMATTITSQNQFHPYGRHLGKQPLLKPQPVEGKRISGTTRQPLQAIPNGLSFAGGTSLFPPAGRNVMGPLCTNVLDTEKHRPVAGMKKCKTDQDENLRKETNEAAQETMLTIPRNTVDFGPVGSKRASAGFIEVKSSFTLDKDGIKSTTSSPDMHNLPISVSNPNSASSGKENADCSTLVEGSGSLNSSFYDKFSSRMEILGSETKSSATKKGILSERYEPWFDFPEYFQEILDYWFEFEGRVKAKPHYMNKQHDITHRMRTILVDWMVEVAIEYEMHDETLHLSVGLIDR